MGDHLLAPYMRFYWTSIIPWKPFVHLSSDQRKQWEDEHEKLISDYLREWDERGRKNGHLWDDYSKKFTNLENKWKQIAKTKARRKLSSVI